VGYSLGFDVGTTGTKALLIDEVGQIVARALVEYPLSTPRPNWAEQDPRQWWAATVEAIRMVLSNAGVSGEEVEGIGLSGQMHGSVFLDEADEVIRPAILWCDQRTAAQCEWITETVGEADIVKETCNPVLRFHRAQDHLAAPGGAGQLCPPAQGPAAQGLHPFAAHRRVCQRSQRRFGHFAF